VYRRPVGVVHWKVPGVIWRRAQSGCCLIM
jgi:hypothetical protein